MLPWSRGDHNPTQNRVPVYVNVYDMLQPSRITAVGYALGFGIFHSGVEVLGREFCFGGHEFEFTGVFVVGPRIGPPGVLFKESINMGYTSLTESEVQSLIKEMSKEWTGNTYNLLTRNCNHFTSEFCRRLVGRSTPGWINRAAKLGTIFPCVVPTEWVEPPEVDGPILRVPPTRPRTRSMSSGGTHSSSQALLSPSPRSRSPSSTPPASPTSTTSTTSPPRSPRPIPLLSSHTRSTSMQSFAEVAVAAEQPVLPSPRLACCVSVGETVGTGRARKGSKASVVTVLRNATSSPTLRGGGMGMPVVGGEKRGGKEKEEEAFEGVKEPEP